MAALLSITVTEPQDILDTFGPDARVYISRGTTDDVDDASYLDYIAIVAGITAYEYADSQGTPGTDRYWLRYGSQTPAVSDDYSDWTGPILAGALAGGPLTIELVRNWSGIAADDTADDTWMPIAIGAINRAAISAVGIDLGPSPDTERIYRSSACVQSGRRLWVPGGLRAFLTVSTGDGTTWTAITSSVEVGPSVFQRPTGEPGSYIEVKPEATVRLDESYYVKITATAFSGFGWDAWPMDLTQDALAAYQRLSKERDGQGSYPTEVAAMRYFHLPLWHAYRARYFPAVR